MITVKQVKHEVVEEKPISLLKAGEFFAFKNQLWVKLSSHLGCFNISEQIRKSFEEDTDVITSVNVSIEWSLKTR